MTVPPRLAAALSAEQRAELDALQAGLERLVASQAPPPQPDPLQLTADLAQWYLRVALDPAASSVSIDTDRCLFELERLAELGVLPSRDGVEALQHRWLREARWPCLPGDDEPPLLRGTW